MSDCLSRVYFLKRGKFITNARDCQSAIVLKTFWMRVNMQLRWAVRWLGFLPRRKEVSHMDVQDVQNWLGLICQVGTLIFAALTYLKEKNKPFAPALKPSM